jgi:hypothetical protein
LILGVCHVAETADSTKRTAGTHPQNGVCMLDAVGPIITIASCVLTPDSIRASDCTPGGTVVVE